MIRACPPALSAAARAAGRKAGSVMTKRAPASASWDAISPGVYSGLIPVTTPPAAIAPKHATSHSGEFGARIASTSPGRRPSAARPAATRRIASASSP